MPRLPRLTGAELVRRLHRLGFETTRIRGSHHMLEHMDGRRTVVPVHARETIGPGLLRKILNDADLTADDLEKA